MSARVLVVDDILPNVKLLEARLKAACFEALAAMSGCAACLSRPVSIVKLLETVRNFAGGS